MSKHLTENRKKWLEYKRKDPFGMKYRFIRSFIFGGFRSHANCELNSCGWMFDENSHKHGMWKLYHCDLEEVDRIYNYKLDAYQKRHGYNNFSPTPELRKIFLYYLERTYELYQQSLQFHHPKTVAERDFHLSWFRKNIKKYGDNVQPAEITST